jgi:hypothetical protein
VVRDAKNDPVGYVDERGGQVTWLSPDRMIGPAMNMSKTGALAPGIDHPELQAAVTRQAQQVQALKATADNPQLQARVAGRMAQTPTVVSRPFVVASGPAQLPAHLRETDVTTAIDADWKAAANDDE